MKYMRCTLVSLAVYYNSVAISESFFFLKNAYFSQIIIPVCLN